MSCYSVFQLSVELGSDSRDFSHMLARTKLAEMTKHNIIALPQTYPKPSLPDVGGNTDVKGFTGKTPET